MKFFLSFIPAVVFMLMVMPASAEMWNAVVESETGATYFYDPHSVVRDGDLVKYWELTNYSKPLKSGNITVVSSKVQALADCKNNRYQILNIFDYSKLFAAGVMTNVDVTGSSPWYTVTPDSVESVIHESICKRP